jgi:hypothetical protein
MIKTEFGIINDFDEKNDYTGYHPEKYNCVAIDDDLYINDWWEALLCIDTLNAYSKGVLKPQKALSRWGTTIIPPSSLTYFYDTVVKDRRYKKDDNLVVLASLLDEAIKKQKYVIHYGV